MFLIQKDIDRFWRNVHILGCGDCWLWKRCCDSWGYGLIWVNGRRESVHRVAWTIANGPIPELYDGLPTKVCHSCDNPPCCNPNHLFLGNDVINQKDSVIKGNHSSLRRGENCPKAVLTKVQAKEIEQLLREKKLLQKEIAEMYGVTPSTVSDINVGRHWRSDMTDENLKDKAIEEGPEEDVSEPWYNLEDNGCQCTEQGFDSEWEWDSEQGMWVCQGCGAVQ